MMASAAVTDPAVIRELQERAARAQPAAYVEHVDGWWLRHAAPDAAWWTGTVLPHGPVEPGELLSRVVTAERFHAERGTLPRFQITPYACPAELDPLLAARGYREEFPISLQVASPARAEEPVGVTVDDRPGARWFDVWQAVTGGDPRTLRAMLDRVESPSGYACALVGDEVVAVGRAVAEDGWAGVFTMATLPRARGAGAGRRVLAGLAGWARAQQAERMYLQVESGNAPALRLYGKAGFTQLCAFHYRAPGSGGELR